ncbi:MAG: HEAT repeat domain-containing protein [Planctomycetaceae bacterium]|nr:HEAT repeat domain-containing protein [Planctomycetaceae bacterium]MCB9939964.1 HEAT repeat domain-containing protein [Planctomycetaceae bacterium]
MGAGGGTDDLIEYDVSRYLSRGRNIIGVKVTNTRGTTAGVAVRVALKETDGQWQSFSSDETWKCNIDVLPLWNTALYNDSRWDDAQVFGKLGETAPWDIREQIAANEGNISTERFKIDKEFDVQELLDDKATGSLISLTFNEFGHILAGRADGPLLLIYDSNDDGTPDKVKTYCDKVKNCQGILALNGNVYVTASGPDGDALYRLSDVDRDGTLEDVKTLFTFSGIGGEHGAHAVTLGPDGMIYVSVGNHAITDVEFSKASPYHDSYEGDLLPRYEDPGGHANDVKAPGGTIIRTDLDGTDVELVAGGLRNAYDLAFNRLGEIFVHDSDMESDEGTTWYRPTRLYHVTPGAELGWRSGWAKWPNYYVDNLPEVLDTGRGSPTGAAFYNHFAFPTRYQNQLFLADWSRGRILNVELKPNGASYSATSEVFLEGQPLNVTDLEVGPDGALYFVTGGRGSGGGIYRITWKGEIPEAVSNLGEGISAAIRQPQLQSAWGRQKIAAVKNSLGDTWDSQILGVARSKSNPWYYRTRALDLMHLFGPPPSDELLLLLAEDGNEIVRAKAAEMMGLHGDATVGTELIAMLSDTDRTVRRKACEALARIGQPVLFEDIQTILASDDRAEAWAARRLLERIPTEQWRDTVLRSDNNRVFIQGAIALLVVSPDEANARSIITRFQELSKGFVSDAEFTDMLRVVQIALHRGEIAPDSVPELAGALGIEFPSGDPTINRELVRLLAYLQVTEPMDRYLAYLKSEADAVNRLHLAMHLRFLEEGWKDGQRIELLEFLQAAAKQEGGRGYKDYIAVIQTDVARSMSEEDGRVVLARGAEWPGAALGALYGLPAELDAQTIKELTEIDQRVRKEKSEAVKSLRVGIVAVLARSGTEQAMTYLRSVWDTDPEHRETVAMGLAQSPEGDNWDYLINSLPIVEGQAAREVIVKLQQVGYRPEEPEYVRQVILRGLEMQDDGAKDASALLQHWTGIQAASPDASWEDTMKAWQEWFAEKYPDRPRAELPTPDENSKWKFDELVEHLTSEQGSQGSVAKGELVFTKAQCAKCHKFGDLGESLGPDLTAISKRFMRKEVLQSILFPSHVISSQHAAKTIVTTNGRSYTGIVGAGAAGAKIVLQANGEKFTVQANEIDEIVPSPKSAMPDGLLNTLTLEEISDLFAYLGVIPSQSVARGRAEDTQN